MAKDKSPHKETKKAPKSNDNNSKKNNNDKMKVKGAVPDLSTAMKQVPMKNLKSLKVKLKFNSDNDK